MRTCYWPEQPALPPPGEPVVVRVAVSSSRQEARREARVVLRAVLAAWSGHEPVWEETPRGPVVRGGGFDVSLSYSGGEAWIGLIRGGRIGVDAMRVESFPELDTVARDYLGPVTALRIRQAPDPVRAFAVAWTAHEATLKCAKHGLNEWTGAVLAAEVESVTGNATLVGAVAHSLT